MVFFRRRNLAPLADRGPLKVMFALTSMPVGGAEVLLVNLIRRLDRERFLPEICCLKQPGPLGEEMGEELPVHSRISGGKYDLLVLRRLAKLFRERRTDAVVTVGAGDKMFWGRLAARRAGVPVVVSALHSTGWPDGVGRLNRLLTPLTDAFIGVAKSHGRHLVENERFPAEKVRVIPNGVDTERFQFDTAARRRLRDEWGISPEAPVCGIVAALRREKNHLLFLRAAARVRREFPAARFVIVGDGPERESLVRAAQEAGIGEAAFFLGTRGDIPQVLSAFDLLALTSHNEANPVSILEAMSVGLPVVATDVGSISETVAHETTGLLTPSGDDRAIATAWHRLLTDRDVSHEMGRAGRAIVESNWSLNAMVAGYQYLLASLYESKVDRHSHKPPTTEGKQLIPAA